LVSTARDTNKYTEGDKNLMSPISSTKEVQVITLNEEDRTNFKRLTGRDSILLERFSAEEIMKVTHESV